MLAALVLAAGCSAPPAFAVTGESMTVESAVEAHVERDVLPGFAEITKPPYCNAFTSTNGQPNFGAVAGNAWLRLAPQLPGTASRWHLLVRFAGLERVCVYWPLPGGTVGECLSRADPAQRERWQSGRLAFGAPAALPPGGVIHVFIQSNFWLKAPLELATTEALLAHEGLGERRWGAYYGVLGAFIVISLGFYLGRRDRAFLWFALHMAALTLALAAWQGRLAPWDPAAFSLTRVMPVLVALSIFLGARFYQTFLLTRRYARNTHKVLEACAWTALAIAPVVGPFPVPVLPLLGAVSLVWLAAIVWAALKRARQGYRPAFWILGAAGVLMAATFLNAVSAMGLGFHHPGLKVAYLGNFLATVFLVFGLIYRVRALADERDRANEIAAASRSLALYRAHFDELTGLPNRAKFREVLQQAIAGMGQAPRRLAIVTIGADRFHAINHALGHEGGDAVLREVAGRLRHELRADEALARTGAATFVATMEIPSGQGLAGLDARCAALRKSLAQPLLSGRGATLSLSLGAALYPDHGTDADALLRFSDEARARANELGGGMLRIFDPQFQQHAERHLEMNQDLRQAIARDQLELHYQPLCELTGSRVLAVEALLRWPHKGKDIPPEQFIPIAESSDLIGPLTDWVFHQVCRQAREWRVAGVDVPICVNVSAPQFRLPGFIGRIDEALKEFSVAPGRLHVEITESLLMDDLVATRATLDKLRERGIDIAVDDFGVGYSSLAYLRTLPVHGIKIDRSFLQGIPGEPESVAVINAIITLGRDLGLTVVAEGIENAAQHEFLVAQGVTAGQGFWLARPMPAPALEQWLHDREATTAAA